MKLLNNTSISDGIIGDAPSRGFSAVQVSSKISSAISSCCCCCC